MCRREGARLLEMILIRRLRFSSDADIVRLTNARIIIIIIYQWKITHCLLIVIFQIYRARKKVTPNEFPNFKWAIQNYAQ